MPPEIRVMPEGFGSAEYKDITNMHPLGLIALLILGGTMLLVQRQWAILPMIIIACFISSFQKIAILNMDFNILRIMVLVGIGRLILRKEFLSFGWKLLDKIVVFWVISSTLIYTLQMATMEAFVNRLGFAFDALGMYFVFRCLIRDWQDLEKVVLSFILVSIPVTVFFLIENQTGRNMFSVFGGVPAITLIRDDRLRCQGAFSHPIIAGCFWASLFPLFLAYWWKSARDRIWAVVGIVTSCTIVVCCASSTPIMGILAALIGWLMYYFRYYMQPIRWGILLGLIALHIVMKAPVWHLIGRVSAVGGSTSYFRYLMINGAITHFHEWALLGTKSTAHWFWGAQDITNQYVLQGVEGGILTLTLFVAIIVFAFREVGYIWRRKARNPYHLVLSWALGVSLFVHCMNFIGVSYFGQIFLVWYMLLAIIGSLSVQSGTTIIPKNRAYRNRLSV